MSRLSSLQSARILLLFSFLVTSISAQEQKPRKPDPDEPKAIALLMTIADRVPNLRSANNRIALACTTGDLLWERNEKQARALFEIAMKDVTETMSNLDFIDQEDFNALAMVQGQRQRLLEVLARRDPEMALSFFRATRPNGYSENQRNNFTDNERNLELNLAAMAAANNPQFALKVARASLTHGVSFGHVAVISQLQQNNLEHARSLFGEVAARFAADDLRQNYENYYVISNLLNSFHPPQSDEDTYRSLVNTLAERVLLLNLSDSSQIQVSQTLFHQLRSSLPNFEKVSPAKTEALRDWFKQVERTFDPSTRMYSELNELGQQGSVDDILALRSKYPEEIHAAIAQQAIWKAMNDNEVDRARQLAEELISDPIQRRQILSQIDTQLAWKASNNDQLAAARPLFSKIKQPDQRVQVTIQFASRAAAKGDKRGALELLADARAYLDTVPQGAARSNAQLQLIRSYCDIEPEQAEAMLQPFITQLNQIISAAVVLDGYDNRNLQEGEWTTTQNYFSVNNLVIALDQVLGYFASKKFKEAETLSGQLERPELKLYAQLSVVEGVLKKTNPTVNFQQAPRVNISSGRRFLTAY